MNNVIVFIKKIHSDTRQKFTTNKIGVHHLDDTCSIGLLDLKDSGSKNNEKWGTIQ